MAEKPSSDRSAATDVVIALGFASVIGDLQTIPKPNVGKDEKFNYVCPDCLNLMGQSLVCKGDEHHGPYSKDQVRQGQQVGDKIIIVDQNKIKEARTSVLPPKTFNLQVHKREDVEANTFPMGNAYVFLPKGNSPFYEVLVELLKNRRDVCFIAKTNMRKADHLIQLDLEMNGQLVIRELIWPEDMKHFDPVVTMNVSAKEKQKLIDQANMLVDVSIEKFDADEYKKESPARISAVLDEAVAGKATNPRAAAKKSTKDSVDSLQDQIAAAIAARKAS